MVQLDHIAPSVGLAVEILLIARRTLVASTRDHGLDLLLSQPLPDPWVAVTLVAGHPAGRAT